MENCLSHVFTAYLGVKAVPFLVPPLPLQARDEPGDAQS